MHYFSTATAEEIASNLGLPLNIIEAWVSRGDLPTLASGLHDRRWATWLTAGRTATAWRRDVPATTAVAAGWRAMWIHFDRAPTRAQLAAFGELFKRAGFTAADALQALEEAGRA